MRKAISNRKLYPAMAGGVLLALVGGATLKLLHTSQAEPLGQESSSVEAKDEVADGSLTPLSPFESEPFLQASPSFRLADPALLQSTSSNARVETVAAGRSDPFAPIVRPSLLPTRPSSSVAAVTPVTSVPAQVSPVQNLPVVPVAATQALPALPVLPAPELSANLPQPPVGVAIAPMNPPVLQSLIDQIVVTGVAQIGDTVNVIVREPGSTSSRHVQQGDLIAGGQVRVKSVDTSNAEPLVILTYNGRDYPRTVGSSALIGSL